MRKMSKIQNVFDSVLIMLLLILFTYLMCNLLLFFVNEIIVPIIALFSYDFHRYLERLENDVMYDGMLEIFRIIVWRVSSIPALFLAAPLAFRFSRSRARYFKNQTGAAINYADGLRLYIREHALFDVIVFGVVTFVFCFWIPDGRMLFPVGTVALGVHPILTWLIIFPLTVLTIPVGAFWAQKHWRAKYICSLLD